MYEKVKYFNYQCKQPQAKNKNDRSVEIGIQLRIAENTFFVLTTFLYRNTFLKKLKSNYT